MFLFLVDLVTRALVFGSAIAALVFVVRFSRTTWRETELGRHMMAFMVMMAVLVSLSMVSIAFGRDWAGWPYLRLLSWLWIFTMLVQRDVLLFKKQHQVRGVADMRSFQFKPVAWLTTVSGILLAVQAANEAFDLLPDRVIAWVGFGSLALVIWLGKRAHDVSTPLANPKNDDGVPLVPVDSPARPPTDPTIFRSTQF